MSGGESIFWVDEIRDIAKSSKMSTSDKQRVERLCACYEELYRQVANNNQKAVLTRYLNWFHDTHNPVEK